MKRGKMQSHALLASHEMSTEAHELGSQVFLVGDAEAKA